MVQKKEFCLEKCLGKSNLGLIIPSPGVSWTCHVQPQVPQDFLSNFKMPDIHATLLRDLHEHEHDYKIVFVSVGHVYYIDKKKILRICHESSA